MSSAAEFAGHMAMIANSVSRKELFAVVFGHDCLALWKWSVQ
jgi:hypothetical protein